ncbi:exported hypothetical protein [Candidatus Zixiibacteriota bacterium]|nr:exported hypothetical protein [candidate division Zixibacteria bacterium]
MKKIYFFKFLSVAIFILSFSIIGGSVLADTLSVPIRIAVSTASDAPTLGIPRWKAYMLETDPNKFWACYANGSSTLGNISYTGDGGRTWNTNEIQIDPAGYLDMHCSVFGRNGNMYMTWPGRQNSIVFRKFKAPIHSNADGDAIVPIAGTSSRHRSNIMVQITGRIWLFTRLSYASPSENVLYNYSDNEGASWTHGTAFATNSNSVRIGSMPYAGGRPALVVLYLNDPRGFEYYLWNGRSFEARPDHSIYGVNMGSTRAFTHNVVNDTTFHLIFGLGNSLHHMWKNYANGTGNWNHEIIDGSVTTNNNEWYPISTVRGNDLYLFYCKKSSSDNATSMIYYKKWSQQSQTWTEPVLVSTDAANRYNRDPNTCFSVPANSPYVPVIWRCGTGPYDIFFDKVMVASDTVQASVEYNLGIASSPEMGGTTDPPAGSYYYPESTRVNIAASAAAGYEFADWSGDVENPAASTTTVLMSSDKTVKANFVAISDLSGSIHGTVQIDSGGLRGVYVDLLDLYGGLVKRATTDIDGSYAMDSLSPGSYIVDLNVPLGFDPIGSPSTLVTIADTGIQVDYKLRDITTGNVADYWWWRRQIEALRDNPSADVGITIDDIDNFGSSIFDHFYQRTDQYAMRIDDATYADNPARALTFNDIAGFWLDSDNDSTSARIRKHLLACLLNVASNRLSQNTVVSVDGATASQAITYLAGRYAGGDVNDATIWYNLSLIHTQQLIAAGVIPLSTPNIMYKPDSTIHNGSLANEFGLAQNRPNPFNPVTTIRYAVPAPGHVSLEVFDLLGRKVRTLVDDMKSAGIYRIEWDGRDEGNQPVSSGVYFYKLRAGSVIQTRKMLLLK